jgi:hypothetical protein
MEQRLFPIRAQPQDSSPTVVQSKELTSCDDRALPSGGVSRSKMRTSRAERPEERIDRRGDEELHGVGDQVAGQDVGVPAIREPGDDKDKERDCVRGTRGAKGDLLVAVAEISLHATAIITISPPGGGVSHMALSFGMQ